MIDAGLDQIDAGFVFYVDDLNVAAYNITFSKPPSCSLMENYVGVLTSFFSDEEKLL